MQSFDETSFGHSKVRKEEFRLEQEQLEWLEEQAVY